MTAASLAAILFGAAITLIQGLTLYVVNDMRARVVRLEDRAMKGG